MTYKSYWGLLILTAAIFLTPLLIQNEYYLGILVFTAFNCLAAVGLSLLMGYAGQISIGHAAFIAIGAYATAILSVNHGWSPWSSMAAGALLAGAIALVVGIPTLRLKGHYLAMATLGFGSIVHIVAVAAVELTGGPSGINGIPTLSFMGVPLDNDLRFFYFSWAVVIIGILVSLNLIHSRLGRGLRAIHGSENAANAVGLNTTWFKIWVFVLSAVYAAVSGSLYACYVSYIDPGPFGIMHSVLLVTMVAVGGIHRIWGAVVGAVLLSILPELLSFTSDYLAFTGLAYKPDYDTLVYGLILLLIVLFLPEGLLDGLGRAYGRVAAWFGGFAGRPKMPGWEGKTDLE